MRNPDEILDQVDWTAVEHAYDVASDVPATLADLLSGEAPRCGGALAELDSTVLHQGTIYSVTPHVAEFVAGILGDPRTLVVCESGLPWDDRRRPLRAALLTWLGEVADSAAHGEDERETVSGPSPAGTLAVRALRPDLFAAVLPLLDDPDHDIKKAATVAAARLVRAEPLARHRESVAGILLRSVSEGDRTERTGIALELADLGFPRLMLGDPDPAVRAMAASVPALDEDPAALIEVRRALQDPRAADDWFPRRPDWMDGRPRFRLVDALLRRSDGFAEIVDEACAVARMTNAYTADADWGPLLVRAFPDGDGSISAMPPRRFLRELVDNDDCWQGVDARRWFARAGLPHDRSELTALLAAQPD